MANREVEMILFIRIPKNASTSLYESFGKDNVINARVNYISSELNKLKHWKKIIHPSHIGLDLIVKYLGKDQLNLLTICCTRNPYDRLISAYSFTRKYELWRIYQDKEPTFEEFVHEYCKRKEDNNFSHAHSQTMWITFKGKIRADVILRFEHLEEDFSKLNQDYGTDYKLPHLNITNHRNFKEYYDRELSSLVFKSYREDFENFDYQQI